MWFGLLLGVSIECMIMFLVLCCLNWKKESRKIKYYNQLTDASSNQLYPFEDVTQAILGSRSLGGFFMSLKTVEDELLELEAIEMEENPL